MSLIQVTALGVEHGLLKKVANSVQGDGFKYMTPEQKEKAEKKKKNDSKVTKARYINKIGKNETLQMPYCLGAGEPIQMWKFLHEHVYEVPQGLIDQVNSKKVINRQGKCDEDGENPLAKDEYEESEHRFFPASF